MVDRGTLLALEEGFWGASGDGGYYREHLADDGLMVFPAPVGVLDKRQTVEAVDSAAPWVEFSLDEVSVVEPTQDSAVLVYRATARRDGDTRPYVTHASSVYVRRGGRWVMVLHQQTPSYDA